MTLHQLQVFTTVAKLGSFTQAGKALRIGQPSVTALVRSLSRELGVQLFERFGVKSRLTGLGEEWLRLAEEILGTVEQAKQRIAEVSGRERGKILIGGSSSAASSFLPVAVQAFKKKHAGIEVTLKIERSEILERKLLEGELDTAVMGQLPRSPLLKAVPYREEEIVLIAPPKHPLGKRRSVSLKLIAKQPLIANGTGSYVRAGVEKRFAEIGLPFAPVLEVTDHMSGEAIKSAVASGLGIGFITKCHVLSDIEAGKLQVLKAPDLKLKRTMYLVVYKKRRSSPAVQTFVDFLRSIETALRAPEASK
ncbi:MAG TPA: LysR family transcriptional regulator [Candidatus Binatia bacterium]|jgi:DNA-binding transcriptional LysR family regulator